MLSGAGDAERSRQAMDAVDRRLVRRDHGLIQLLDPPFDKSDAEPGLHQGLRPRRSRERRSVHPCRGVGRRWRLPSWATAIAPGNCCRSSIRSATRDTEDAVAVYKVEPYVVAADVYAVAPHTGRGGWTWYTGSAGWMYRLIVESLLGLKREGDRLYVTPCMPKAWQEYSLSYRYEDTVYRIAVERTSDANAPPIEATLDGAGLAEPGIPLVDDRREHVVRIRIGTTP